MGRAVTMLRHVTNAVATLRENPSLEGLRQCSREPYEPGEELPWWADNLAHFTCGLLIGILAQLVWNDWLLAAATFLLLTTVWEIFEYTHEVRPWDPRDGWSLDRAVEDTLLDTYVGLTGALIGIWLLTL